MPPQPDSDTVQRLASLCGETDLVLATNFANAQVADSVALGTGGGDASGYWGTHANQAGAFRPLSTNLLTLDRGLVALKVGLGQVWIDTAIFPAASPIRPQDGLIRV